MKFGPRSQQEAEVFATEGLLVDFQQTIHELLLSRKVSRREFAKRMGFSEARASQLFSAEANPTLRLIAKAFFVLGEECAIVPRSELSPRVLGAAWRNRCPALDSAEAHKYPKPEGRKWREDSAKLEALEGAA